MEQVYALEELKESLESLKVVEQNLINHIQDNPEDVHTKTHLKGVRNLIEERNKQIKELESR